MTTRDAYAYRPAVNGPRILQLFPPPPPPPPPKPTGSSGRQCPSAHRPVDRGLHDRHEVRSLELNYPTGTARSRTAGSLDGWIGCVIWFHRRPRYRRARIKTSEERGARKSGTTLQPTTISGHTPRGMTAQCACAAGGHALPTSRPLTPVNPTG